MDRMGNMRRTHYSVAVKLKWQDKRLLLPALSQRQETLVLLFSAI